MGRFSSRYITAQPHYAKILAKRNCFLLFDLTFLGAGGGFVLALLRQDNLKRHNHKIEGASVMEKESPLSIKYSTRFVGKLFPDIHLAFQGQNSH